VEYVTPAATRIVKKTLGVLIGKCKKGCKYEMKIAQELKSE
jgi:hypothetical protein